MNSPQDLDYVKEKQALPCSSDTGHNGAGKTTLMKEIAAHRIVGMPPDRGMDLRGEWDIYHIAMYKGKLW